MSLQYLAKCGKWYYFRLRLPGDVQPLFQSTHLKKSLKTTSYRQATTLVKVLSASIERAIFMLRSGLLSPELIQQIVTDVKEGILEMHRKHGRNHGNRSQEYREKAAALKLQLQERDYTHAAEDAEQRLEAMDITADSTSPEYATLCDGLLRAKMRAFEVMAERDDGNLNNRYDNGLLMRVKEPKHHLSALMDDYISMNSAGWGVRTKARKEGNFRKVLEVLGDIYTCNVSKDKVQLLYNELKTYPVNRFKNPYVGKSLAECRLLPQFQSMHSTTIKDVWVDVTALLKFGSENEKYRVSRNYAADSSFSKTGKNASQGANKRAVYDKFDIECLFKGLAQENRVRQPHRYWIPLIGLYQGMRQNEICQLWCDDIIEVDGIDCIRITENTDRNQKLTSESDTKSIKNEQSRRTIPIHPALIQLGFLDFVESRKKLNYKRVWENLKTPAVDYYAVQGNHSHFFSKWYCGTFRKNHIINNPELKPFHSLRHTLINWFFQNIQDLDFTAVKGLVGHVDSDEQKILGALFNAVTWRVYAKEINPSRLLETLKKLDYGVDLDLLQRKSFLKTPI